MLARRLVTDERELQVSSRNAHLVTQHKQGALRHLIRPLQQQQRQQALTSHAEACATKCVMCVLVACACMLLLGFSLEDSQHTMFN
jgi:hypothetical protein